LTEARRYARPLIRSSPSPAKQVRRVRRSTRLKLTVPVLVHGKAMSGEPFRELTRTLSVNAQGGLLGLAATVEKGQTLVVENKNTRKEQECRVAYIGPTKNGKWSVGIEFTQPAPDFWRIYFPPFMPN
jgi:hypothetical protein